MVIYDQRLIGPVASCGGSKGCELPIIASDRPHLDLLLLQYIASPPIIYRKCKTQNIYACSAQLHEVVC